MSWRDYKWIRLTRAEYVLRTFSFLRKERDTLIKKPRKKKLKTEAKGDRTKLEVTESSKVGQGHQKAQRK